MTHLKLDLWPPSRTEAKNECSYKSTPPTSIRGVNRGDFVFFNIFVDKGDAAWRISFYPALVSHGGR